MPELTLVPSSTLTLPSEAIARPNRFILFSDSWLALQNYIETCLQLPVTKGGFEERYGSFGKRTLVDDAVRAMRDLNALGGEFGNPTILKARIAGDASYLFTPAPPAEIYSHVVWLALQIQNAASTFKFTLANLKEILEPGAGTKEERARNLRELLIGPRGLVSLAQDMSKNTNSLISKLMRFDAKVKAANDRMTAYTSQQSEILQAANRLVGEYTERIEKELRPASEAALKAWEAYTIAAVSASVTLAVVGVAMMVLAPVTFGTTFVVGGILTASGVAAGVGLGIAAKHQRDVYNDLVDQIAAKELEKRQKVLLVSDLSAFNTQMATLGSGLSDFRRNLETIEGIWLDVGSRLSHICLTYGVEQLSDLPWVNQVFQLGDAQNKWGEISTTTQEFTQNSLVDYSFLKFGERVVA